MVLAMLSLGLAVLAPLPVAALPYGAEYWPSLAPTFTSVQKQLGQKAETFLDGITPGKTVIIEVLVKNTGDLNWTLDAFLLSYHWVGPENIWDGERTPLPKNTAPGEKVTLNATLKVPATPGTYTLQWDMVQESVTWFSSANVPVESQLVGVGGRVGAGGGLIGYILYQSELCQWTDCTGATEEQLKCPFPKITSGAGQLVRPGKFVYVTGCGFGEQQGLFLLRLQDGMELKLTIEGWYPGIVGGTVPDVPSGTQDQVGQLVVKAGGSASNPAFVQFKAKREIKLVPMEAVQVKECADTADENICNNVDASDSDWDTVGFIPYEVVSWSALPGSTFASIGGYHYNTSHISGDVGWDKYTATVKNGYVFHDIKSSYENIDGGHASNIEGFDKGGASTTFTMQWSADGDGGVYYTIDLLAIGPIGVPLK
jgi:hypothetical protein